MRNRYENLEKYGKSYYIFTCTSPNVLSRRTGDTAYIVIVLVSFTINRISGANLYLSMPLMRFLYANKLYFVFIVSFIPNERSNVIKLYNFIVPEISLSYMETVHWTLL